MVLLFFDEFQYFLTTNHITAISSKASMEYVTIGDTRELVMTGTVTDARGISWDNGTASAPPNCFATPSLEINFSEYAGQL